MWMRRITLSFVVAFARSGARDAGPRSGVNC
jgi:hypothetical protein